MAWALPILVAVLQAGTPVVVARGILPARGPIPPALFLGPGEPAARALPRAAARADASGFRTPGGFIVRRERAGLRLEAPAGTVLEVTADGRIRGSGRSFTRPARVLGLGFEDGSFLMVEARGARKGIGALALWCEGRLLVPAAGEARPAARLRRRLGPRYYWLEGGRTLAELALFGPLLRIAPVARAGGRTERHWLVLADLLREAGRLQAESAPQDRIQDRLYTRRAALLAGRLAVWFRPSPAAYQSLPRRRAAGLLVPAGEGAFFRLGQRGRALVLELRPGPEAAATLEFHLAPGRAVLRRLLPPALRRRSRGLGRDVDLEALLARALPWPLPLAGPRQRRRAREALAALATPAIEAAAGR